MEKHQEQPQFIKDMEKPKDWLPDGTDKGEYLKEDKEWPRLEDRLGQPRILEHVYFSKVFDWIQKKYKDNLDGFSYFEAGCGHGNDLRAMRKELGGKGRFLGVDMSKAEIRHGLEFYRQKENEDIKETKKLFAQGNLCDLKRLNVWDKAKEDFSQPTEIKDGEFALIYTEAVLHGLGYGKKTFQEKKEAAQQMLDELHRIGKTGGKFFGRANVFSPSIIKKQQFELLRKENDWHFIPKVEEFEEMLRQAGFINIKKTLAPHKKAKTHPNKKDVLLFSFLAENS